MIGDGVAYTAAYYLCGIAGVYNWLTISVAHYRFRKGWIAQGHSQDELQYLHHYVFRIQEKEKNKMGGIRGHGSVSAGRYGRSKKTYVRYGVT